MIVGQIHVVVTYKHNFDSCTNVCVTLHLYVTRGLARKREAFRNNLEDLVLQENGSRCQNLKVTCVRDGDTVSCLFFTTVIWRRRSFIKELEAIKGS